MKTFKKMMKIGTHNSITGEKGDDFISLLGTPFAKCQSKTLKEQYEAGCRLFDLRVLKVDGTWKGAHGLWHSKRTIQDIWHELESYGDCYAIMTYEGNVNDTDFKDFKSLIEEAKTHQIHWVYFAAKKPEWEVIDYTDPTVGIRQGFLVMGSDWHSILPIPYIWRKKKRVPFDDKVYTLVDFL